MQRPRSWIAILDFGSQYTHLIARRVRDLGVYSEILPHDGPAESMRDAAGIILSGGPQSVLESDLRPDRALFDLGKPVLGLCFGHQLIAALFGGELHQSKEREYGEELLRIPEKVQEMSKLLSGLGTEEVVWMSHGDSVSTVPDGFSVLGATATCPVAAMSNARRRIYSLQFHPEVAHTKNGMTMLSNFLFAICKARKTWNPGDHEEELLQRVREQAGKRNVFLLASGGVDSTVTFALLTKALGKKRVRGLFIDTGFMRLGEEQEIREAFEKLGYSNFDILNAQRVFFKAIKDVDDPEEKRKRIGAHFLTIAEEYRVEHGYVSPKWVIAQGTIYPDTIESGGTRHAETIKTHHNRVPEAQEAIARNELIEPIANLYKDEVRELGKRLRLPSELLTRHPFPGPGLAIRILTAKAESPFRLEDTIRAELKNIRPDLIPHYAFHVLPVVSVGVQGDQRTYAHPLAISGPLYWSTLRGISKKLLRMYREINRAIYVLNPDCGILRHGVFVRLKVEERHVALLQKVDHAVKQYFVATGAMDAIWQVPVVLIPFGVGRKPSIVIRPVVSHEAMTVAPYELTTEHAEGLRNALDAAKLPISGIFYDITDKPPGTIEWE